MIFVKKMQEALYIIDSLITKHTGKGLSDLQKTIIVGTIDDKTYNKIGEDNNFSQSHVNKVANQLWHQLSDILNEKVNKKNLKWTIEKNYKSNISNATNVLDNNNNENNQAELKEDLREIPYLNSFYGRSEELTNLICKILEKKQSRLVSILGVCGIGKTALTLKLIEQIKTNFNYLIYRSLNTLLSLNQITEDIIEFISPEPTSKLKVNKFNQLSLLKSYLSNHRCLIILDDVHKIFSKGKLAGNYQSGYEDYGEIFKIIIQIAEQSCLILVSQELPLELVYLSEEHPYYSSLLLTSLGESARGILQEKQLLDEDKWADLINIYEGNPSYLRIITRVIKELFAGSVNDFFAYSQPFLDDEIKSILQQQLNRLTEEEKEILTVLAQENKQVSFSQLQLLVKVADLINNIKSLGRRNLIKKIQLNGKNQIVFEISPLLRQYLLNK